MAKRHQHVEHAILTLVNACDDRDGYPNTVPGLASIVRRELPDIADREILDALKRLNGRYLTIYKYIDSERRFDRFPDQIADEERVFYRADFRMRRTPHTDPQLQALALEIHPPEAPMTPTIDEAGRNARFDRWEQLGLERIKADLVHNGGSREVGGSSDVRNLAWEWVRMKEAEVAAAKPKAPTDTLRMISEGRLDELRNISSSQFDLRKLIRLCEEINIAYGAESYLASAMLVRGLLDHVPPLFAFKTFSEVANNYGGGGRSFKETMQHLENASRKIADAHLHTPIRKSETLPTAQQVHCAQQLDVLLSEIVRRTR